VLDRRLWSFSRKSISDWKNIYLEKCNGCSVRDDCGGFFQSAAKKHSAHIRPILGYSQRGDTLSPVNRLNDLSIASSTFVRSSAAKIVNAAGNAPLLDVGCGWGADAVLLAQLGATVICVDRELAGIESQRSRLGDGANKSTLERLILRHVDLDRESWPF